MINEFQHDYGNNQKEKGCNGDPSMRATITRRSRDVRQAQEAQEAQEAQMEKFDRWIFVTFTKQKRLADKSRLLLININNFSGRVFVR